MHVLSKLCTGYAHALCSAGFIFSFPSIKCSSHKQTILSHQSPHSYNYTYMLIITRYVLFAYFMYNAPSEKSIALNLKIHMAHSYPSNITLFHAKKPKSQTKKKAQMPQSASRF